MKILKRQFLNTKTPTCHAATVFFKGNNPIFAWFGGTREGLPDSCIYVQDDEGIKTLGQNSEITHWNPVLFGIEGRVFLSYKIGEFCDRWLSKIIDITDIEGIDCLDNLPSQTIPAGLNFSVKTKPLIAEKGLVYCGSSVETRWDWSAYIEVYEYSGGQFRLQERSLPLIADKIDYECVNYYGRGIRKTLGIIQPALWVDDKKTMHAFFRSSKGLEKIYYSQRSPVICVGYGLDNSIFKWKKPEPTNLSNPNSSIDVVYFNGRLFLAHNPESTRYPLIVRELDADLNTVDSIVIANEPMVTAYSPEFSYPYMVEHDGELHLVYTHQRTKIEYVVISV